jgi:tRNA modification GTPase
MFGQVLIPRHATLLDFYADDGSVIDQGIGLYFEGPASFTGEDVLELQGHGGPVVLDMLLQTILAHGARLSRPGEFTERAFLNDKIDLTQAEAIADLIDSHSRQAARSAVRSLQGQFSQHIHTLVQELISLRSYVEAAIDFVEEDIDFLSDGQVGERLSALQAAIEKVQIQAQQGVLLRDGMNVVIAGPPNAGKSSLLNYLSGSDSAIVTELAGTTRDVLRENIVIDGLPIHIIDTAGLRESTDPIEQIGIQRARNEIDRADLILLVFDDANYNATQCAAMQALLPENSNVVVVRNKIDLSGASIQQDINRDQAEIFISVKQEQGIDLLREHLKACAGFHPGSEDGFIARRRHLDALSQATTCLAHGSEQLQIEPAGELLAEDLRQAQQALSQITGEFSSDDLLGNIFSSFCVGK